MGFLRVVELFPPLFPAPRGRSYRIDVEASYARFVAEAQTIRRHADVLLVADVKSPGILKLSSFEAAVLLKQRSGVEAAPVIVLRDLNRPGYLSAVLSCLSLGFRHLMIAWGDDYPPDSGFSTARGFTSLAESIREAALLRKRTRAATTFFAPVNLASLATSRGVAMAKGRLRAGAEFLLAQPPTIDLEALGTHLSLLRGAKLESRVLLNVFPFKGPRDVRQCERYFGWRLPKRLHLRAGMGESALREADREVVKGLREAGLPGVYLNTRGTPAVAGQLLR